MTEEVFLRLGLTTDLPPLDSNSALDPKCRLSVPTHVDKTPPSYCDGRLDGSG